MKTINPKDLATPELQNLLQGAICPRPIAFASTINAAGEVNLSPFSFFNLFSANPPILVFSPSRRVRDNTTKHTLDNVLASTEYPQGINEFVKAGLTAVTSNLVAPPRVKESPVAFECKVQQVVSLGDQGGAGNLVICEILQIHIDEAILDASGAIAPLKLDPVARLGGNWYTRVTAESLFQIPKPLLTLGIGVDQIPEEIRTSPVLSGNNLGRLANVERLPSPEELALFSAREDLEDIRRRFRLDEESWIDHLHRWAKEELEAGNVDLAWKILLQKP
jgi:flavin reductase (DIM6/NTAB) family NADH-FMN oxidoreductase RutF